LCCNFCQEGEQKKALHFRVDFFVSHYPHHKNVPFISFASMTEEQIQYIVHLHEKMDRQGPGSDEETRKALEITGLDKHQQ